MARVWETLLEIALDRYGFVTPAAAADVGVDPAQLRILAARGRIEHVAHGLYRMPLVPATERDQYMEMVLRTQGRGVLSHATALDLHGLCDANPDVIHLTVPVGFRTRRQLPGVVRIHRKELQHGEHTLHEGIPIVTPLRAIRDGIEMGLGAHLIEQAITTALETGAITELEREQLDAAAPRVASARL